MACFVNYEVMVYPIRARLEKESQKSSEYVSVMRKNTEQTENPFHKKKDHEVVR